MSDEARIPVPECGSDISTPHCAMEPIPDSRAAERGEGKERTQNRCVETGEREGTLTEEGCIQHRALRKRALLRGLQAKASGSWIHLMQVAKAKVRLSIPPQGSPCLGQKYKAVVMHPRSIPRKRNP